MVYIQSLYDNGSGRRQFVFCQFTPWPLGFGKILVVGVYSTLGRPFLRLTFFFTFRPFNDNAAFNIFNLKSMINSENVS